MRLHAIVSDLDTARAAVEGRATVVQLRLKGASTREMVDQGYAYRHLCKLHGVTFVVNDDVEAAIALGADGVHLGRQDPGAERAVAERLLLGTSAASVEDARVGEGLGAGYIGAGPVWPSPSKPDAGPRSVSARSRRSAKPFPFQSWQSGGSMRPTRRNAWPRAQPVSRSFGPPLMRRPSMRLSQLGELGLLAELEKRGLARQIDNDAAQLEDGLVVTQDALVEDVHFRWDLLTWTELGYRAAAVNLSDLAASGAEPEGLVVTLALPSETQVDDVLALYEGLNEPGVPVVGGDTSRAEHVMLSVTALGRSERVPGRGGARPGDVLVVDSDSARPEQLFATTASCALRCAWPRERSSRHTRTPCSTSPTGLPLTPLTLPRARLFAA